jgi:hypothetical protein
MSKFVKGLLIGLGVLVALAVLAAVGFQIYGMATYGRIAAGYPMMGFLPHMRGGFGMGWLPWGGAFGFLFFVALIVLVVALILGTAGPRPASRVCAHCGKPLQEGWVACPHCGEKVSS